MKTAAVLSRGASFALSAAEANYRDGRLPYRLFVQLTNRCNSRCKTCAIWQKPLENELSTEELLSVLRQASSHIKWMDFTGGEIFLRRDLETLLRFVANEMPRLFMFHFATNGSYPAKAEHAARIIAASPIPRFIVTVSLDGPPALHDQIRGIRGAFGRALQTFRLLRQIPVDVVLGMTLSDLNRGQFEPTLEAVQKEIPDVSPADFHINLAQVSDFYYANRDLLTPPGVALLEELERIARARGSQLGPVQWLERSYLREARHFLERGRTPLPCEALSSSLVLSPTGELYPCIIFEKSIGNVRSSGYSIASVWEGAARRNLRQEIQAERCPHCWTPCEAYQTIIANALPLGKNRRRS